MVEGSGAGEGVHHAGQAHRRPLAIPQMEVEPGDRRVLQVARVSKSQ